MSRMRDRFTAYTVSRVLGTDGGYTDTDVVMYSGVPGRLRSPGATVSEREAGAQVHAVQDVQIHVPIGATPNVVVNVLWRCTASAVNPSRVGRVFRTTGMLQGDTADRYPVEQVS